MALAGTNYVPLVPVLKLFGLPLSICGLTLIIVLAVVIHQRIRARTQKSILKIRLLDPVLNILNLALRSSTFARKSISVLGIS